MRRSSHESISSHRHQQHVVDSEDSVQVSSPNYRQELQHIVLLAPWTQYVVFEPSFSDELNQDLAQRVTDVILDELEKIYIRLRRQQEERDAMGITSPHANRTLLENCLVVEAKRKIDPVHITRNMITAMKTALALADSPNITVRPTQNRSNYHARAQHHTSSAKVRRAWQKKSVIAQMIQLQQSQAAAVAEEQAAISIAMRNKESDPSSRNAENDAASSSMLCVQFPKREQTLSDAVAEAEAASRANIEELNNQVTHFRHRPVSSQGFAVGETDATASNPSPRRSERVRYIMSTRLGALPPTKKILDEYPIPKEILDALEKHRHFHVDESSLTTSFEAISLSDGPEGQCHFRRSVPIERKPISFVLSSLEIAPPQPVQPPSDIFDHAHELESGTISDDVLLTQVRKLYDYTHDSYREFRSSLHRHLDLQYLVDLSFRSSLTSTNCFIDDGGNDDDGDGITSSEATIVIPQRLLRVNVLPPVSKWRLLAQRGQQNAKTRMATRRGALAVHMKSETAMQLLRTEVVNTITRFSVQEVQLMELWATQNSAIQAGEKEEEIPFDPVAMNPELSVRFDAVWKDVRMPAHDRLDLAIKYSALENVARLPDAVRLWEVAAALIKEREQLVSLMRNMPHASIPKLAAVLVEENGMLQDLATCTTHLKEALMLTYVEVGDFVTYEGNFYLARMEFESAEMRRIILDSLEPAKQKTEGSVTTEANSSASVPPP